MPARITTPCVCRQHARTYVHSRGDALLPIRNEAVAAAARRAKYLTHNANPT